MRRTFIFAALVLACFSIPSSVAALGPKVKIGIIDTPRILRESKIAREVRGAFLMELEGKRSVLKAKQEEVKNLETRLKKEEAAMNAQERKDASQRFAKEVKELRRLKTDIEDELKKKDAELSRKLILDIKKVVEKYLKDQKFTLILEKKTVVASDDAVDITEDIIRAFDKTKK